MHKNGALMHINLARVLYTGIVTMIYLSFINTCRDIQGTILSKAGFPDLSFMILEIQFMIGPLILFFMDNLINSFYYRSLFYFSSLGNIISLACILIVLQFDEDIDSYLIQLIVLLLSLITAPMSSIFYCTYNLYINQMASKANKSLYFGLGYSTFCASSVIAAMYGRYLYPMISDITEYFSIMLVSCFLMSNLYWFVRECNSKKKSIDMTELQVREMNKNPSLNQKNEKENSDPLISKWKKRTLNTSYREVYKIMRVEYFVYLIPNLIMIGVLQAFTGAYYVYLSSIGGNNQYVNIYNISMFNGIGQFLGGLTAGLVGDSFGQYKILIINQGLILFSCGLLTLGVLIKIQLIISIFAVCMGFAIGSQITITYSFMAARYYKYPQLFVLVSQLYCFGFGLCEILFFLQKNYSIFLGIGNVSILTIINAVLLYKYQNKIQQLQSKKAQTNI